VAVVGAGVAGLVAAAELARAGRRVVVLEREDRVGGLARSFRYGDFTFDVGPHRFHSHDQPVMDYVRRVLGDGALEIERASAVYLRRHLYPWPLRALPLLRLGPRVLASAALDLVHRPAFDGVSFESLALSRYGHTLHSLFTRTATRKFTSISCRDLHYTWLEQSMDRAIIDRRMTFDSITGLLKVVLKPRVRTMCVYPSGGCGAFAERLRDTIEAAGGEVVTGAGDVAVEVEGRRVIAVTAAGRRRPLRELVWTAPATTLARLLGRPDPGLQFTDTILLNLEVDRPVNVCHQWIYYGELKYLFVRVSFPRLFDAANVPAGRGAVCVEVVNTNPAWWEHPRHLLRTVERHLAEVGLCRPEDIRAVHVERVPESYPIYQLDYLERAQSLLADLGRYANLTCLGRCGRFQYNNMDDSIRDALAAADDLADRLT